MKDKSFLQRKKDSQTTSALTGKGADGRHKILEARRRSPTRKRRLEGELFCHQTEERQSNTEKEKKKPQKGIEKPGEEDLVQMVCTFVTKTAGGKTRVNGTVYTISFLRTRGRP